MFGTLRAMFRFQRLYRDALRLRRTGRPAEARVVCLEMLRTVTSGDDVNIAPALSFGTTLLCGLSDETGCWDHEAEELRRLRGLFRNGLPDGTALAPSVVAHERWIDKRLRWLDARASASVSPRTGDGTPPLH